MRKQDYLLELIQSLSASEKRYFRLYTSLQPGAKGYMKLYDLLEKESSYDTGVLSLKLKTNPKKLAHEKEYLQQVLLRALRNFEQDLNPQTSLVHRYMEADMLSRRGLKEFALSHLDKTYEKTMQYEQHGAFINSFLLRHALAQNRHDPSPAFGSYELYKQQMEQLNEIVELEFLYDELVPLLINRNDEKAMKAISKRGPMLKKPEELLSSRARVIYYTMHIAITAIAVELGPEAAEYAGKLVDTFEKSSFLKQVNPTAYLYSYYRLALCLPYNQGERALKVLDTALSIINSNTLAISSKVIDQFRFDTQMQKLNLLNGLFRYQESIAVAREILHYSLDETLEYKRIGVLFLYAAALLFTGRGEEALVPLREILKGNKKARQDMQLRAMLLELLIQYDLKNYLLIPYQVQSIKKWIRRKELTEDRSASYLKWMLRISAAAASGNQKGDLKAFAADVNAGKISIRNEEINIKYWLDEKLKRLK